jgi:aminoglycoside phosphotransferase (APT) family kinase protein
MIDRRTQQILRYITRDLGDIIAPELTSPRAQFAAGAMKDLLEGMLADPAPAQAASDSLGLRELVAIEEAARPGSANAREAAYRQSGAGMQDASRPADAAASPITSARLTRYLQSRPDYRWVATTEVLQAPGGFSKETYLAKLLGDGRTVEIVLRRDPVFAPLGSTVADEFPLLRALESLDAVIPRVLWLESDAQHFGAAVISMARLPGSADVSRWTGVPHRAEKVIEQAAQLLARLHEPGVLETYTPKPPIPGAIGGTPGEMVADLRRFWISLGFVGDHLVEAIFDWLDHHAPQSFARRALLHGDFGFHNLLVQDGKITGLLDWEFCHAGDVAEDLAYARPFVERVVPWPDFASLYHRFGGVNVPAEAVDFWGVFGILRIGLGCTATLHEIDLGNMKLDSKAAYIAQTYARPFVVDAAKFILRTQ